MLQRGLVRKGFRETDVFFHSEDSYKRGLSQGLGVKLGWPCFALSVCTKPERGQTEGTFQPLESKYVTLKSFSGRKLSTSQHNNSGWRFLQVLGLKFSKLSISSGWLAVSYCKDMFEMKISKRRAGGCILLEFCCTPVLLEGISNWINDCLIPISQLDLAGQTEEAVSYGKERGERMGGGERARDTDG